MKLDLYPSNLWLAKQGEPILIAGPCSAESESQMLATAFALKKIPQVKIFRAGVWKPRTRPNAFSGHGPSALQWLRKVKEETGLPTCVEVANSKHVEDCIANEISMIWIGARTVVNPFSVQEIADALRGIDIPVFVKNPIVPDLQLWIGALERFNISGIKKLVAVHRGFSSFTETKLRYSPEWKIPLELARVYPDLPIICDPSHIAGTREYVYSIAQEALQYGMHGLMIETHVQPEQAWSDAKQQITPAELSILLTKLKFTGHTPLDGASYIHYLQQKLHFLDKQIVDNMGARSTLVKEIEEFSKHQLHESQPRSYVTQ